MNGGLSGGNQRRGGFYYDMHRHPLANIATVQELAQYEFPDPLDPVDARFREFLLRHTDEPGVRGSAAGHRPGAYGCTKFRISMFPVASNAWTAPGGTAREPQ